MLSQRNMGEIKRPSELMVVFERAVEAQKIGWMKR